MTIVKAQDCYDVGLCVRGQIRFTRSHGIDFKAFVKDGLPVEAFAGIDDLNLSKVIARAVEREKEEQK